MGEKTIFNKVGGTKGVIVADLEGRLLAPLTGVSLAKADSYALTTAEKVACVSVAMSAASKSLTLGLGNGDVMLVHNSGDTNAVTVKNLAADAGASLAAGKVALVIGSATADGTVILGLN